LEKEKKVKKKKGRRGKKGTNLYLGFFFFLCVVQFQKGHTKIVTARKKNCPKAAKVRKKLNFEKKKF
jgi:hypothetical protein